MTFYFSSFLIFFILFGNSLSQQFPSNFTDIPEQLNALTSIFDTLGGIGWIRSDNWNSSTSICTWYGVSCVFLDGNQLGDPSQYSNSSIQFTSSVISINLSHNNLVGTLNIDFTSFPLIALIDFSFNSLNGFQVELGNQNNRSFESLKLNGNPLEGNVPDLFSNLPNLKTLDISHTNLSGSLPNSLFGLNSLLSLNVSFTKLSVTLASFSSLSNLVELAASNCGITGQMTRLSQTLSVIQLQNNSITGSVDPSLFNSTSITYIDLSGNSMDGNLPDTFQVGNQLRKLFLYGNRFSGSFPGTLSTSVFLTHLDLCNNRFSGLFPDLSNSHDLVDLALSNNQFDDQFPKISSNLNLQNLRLNNNSFHGGIPDIFEFSSNLTEVLIQDNQFGGSFPSSLVGKLPTTILNCSHNNFVGAFPTTLGSSSVLTKLDLSNNGFNGTIPVPQSGLLTTFYFHDNFFSGRIPLAFSNLLNLTFIDGSRNSLTGLDVTNMWPKLTVCDLSSNSFRCPIPDWTLRSCFTNCDDTGISAYQNGPITTLLPFSTTSSVVQTFKSKYLSGKVLGNVTIEAGSVIGENPVLSISSVPSPQVELVKLPNKTTSDVSKIISAVIDFSIVNGSNVFMKNVTIDLLVNLYKIPLQNVCLAFVNAGQWVCADQNLRFKRVENSVFLRGTTNHFTPFAIIIVDPLPVFVPISQTVPRNLLVPVVTSVMALAVCIIILGLVLRWWEKRKEVKDEEKMELAEKYSAVHQFQIVDTQLQRI
eukprot:TRINITY_DN5805_c0_g1_i1.p1 TRINITY_DN5805_c0_g1~~TRINITY_DN5805_c0_g1_i1.p1  ORF type:complete len:787 (-),score=221.18 TRINITY_DN5805_c0_g1_i1:77-2347(-)